MDFILNYAHYLWTSLVFFGILWILVIVHELGHFWMAKRAGIYVEEFGFGLPPRLWGFQWGETLYSLNWLPFGGFVRLYGEDAVSDEPYEVRGKKISKARAFYAQNSWAKLSVIVAGVVMNFLLAIAVFSFTYSVTGIPEETERVQIIGVSESSPAADVGLKPGDVIVSMNGISQADPALSLQENPRTTSEFINLVSTYKGTAFHLIVDRPLEKGTFETKDFTLTPRENPPAGQGALGVVVAQEVQPKFYPTWQMPLRGSYEGFKEAILWSVMIVKMLGQMVGTLWQGSIPEGVAGPVGIYQLTGEVVKYGWEPTLRFLGILSVNLAVMNIMPFPALDGGRLWFVLYEAVTGKRANPVIERYTHSAGMALLLTMIVLVTIGDVIRIFGIQFGRLWSLVTSF